jgi:type IV secretion system protein TrbL
MAVGQQVPASAPDTTGGFGSAGPSDIANTFYNGTQVWINALKTPARELFWALAGIDLTWTCIALVLQHQDLYPWLGGFIRKLLTIGFFAVLLENGTAWIADIVNFFINLGSTAGGRNVAGLSASNIMVSGIQLAGHMLHSAAGTAATSSMTNPISLLISGPSSIGTVLVLILGAILMVIAYVVIALHFVIAMVEAYVTVGAGYIFLGFGGSRWTVPYTEKYIGMVVAAGVRIMVLELMIGLGSTLYTQWDAMAQKIAAIPDIMDGGSVAGQWSGVQLEFALISSILIYALLCWTIPQIASNVVAGGLSMSGGDVIGSSIAAASAGATAASLASGSSASSTKAVAEVAQAAAMTGAQMGMQLGAAAMTGGGSVAATSAASGVAGATGGGAVSSVGGAAGMAADGFTPPPPGMGTPDIPGGSFTGSGQGSGPASSVTSVSNSAAGPEDAGLADAAHAADGVAVAEEAAESAQMASEAAASSAATASQIAQQARSEAEGVTPPPPPINVSGGAAGGPTPGVAQGTTPQTPTGGSGLGGTVDTLRTVIGEGERAMNRLPDSGGHVGGTTPKVDHGE